MSNYRNCISKPRYMSLWKHLATTSLNCHESQNKGQTKLGLKAVTVSIGIPKP